jgi:hypothetical protein
MFQTPARNVLFPSFGDWAHEKGGSDELRGSRICPHAIVYERAGVVR